MKYAYFGNNQPAKINNQIWSYDEIKPEVVFSFGGDGTMLGAIHKYSNNSNLTNIYFVGIKSGKLGYFYSFTSEDFSSVIDLVEKKNFLYNVYNLLEYSLKGDKIISNYAVNEIAITNPIHTQIIDVYINDFLFESFRGTGFIASPPAGSTAYSRSMGGSIISPDLEAFQLVEIASINNSLYKTISSPLIFSNKYNVSLKLVNKENVYVSVDGKEINCENLTEIDLKLSDKKINILTIDENFFKKVKKAFLEK